MKKLAFLLIQVLPIVLLAQTEQINEDWLKKDKSNFINLTSVFQSENHSFDFYKDIIENLDIRDSQEIGFGAKRIECVQHGGYISNWISICTFKGEIFYCKVSITSDDVEKMELLGQKDSIIFKLLSENWNKKSFKQNSSLFESFDYEFKDESLYSKFMDSVKIELGGLSLNTPIDSSLKKYYDILVSPFEKYDFGYACYFAGTPPIGRTAIEKIKENNPRLIRNIIKGYSPEGRIYGIEALLELAAKGEMKLTSQDIIVIKKVLNLNIPINRCKGCMGFSILARKLFNETKYKKILKNNSIKLK